jgi:hypothetical protein
MEVTPSNTYFITREKLEGGALAALKKVGRNLACPSMTRPYACDNVLALNS